MRIDIRDEDRQYRGRVTLDDGQQPASVQVDGSTVALHWAEAFDAEGLLRRCPVCGCHDIFARRDFPQRFGMVLVVIAGVASVVLFATGRVLPSLGVLAGAVVLDFMVLLVVRRCLVCYRCRSEFRDVTVGKSHEGYDLATGEKYRSDTTATDESP